MLYFRAMCSTRCFWKVEKFVSVLSFVWNLQTVFPLKSMFSGGPSFFVHFVFNDGALNLRLHVVALLASVTMSWPVEKFELAITVNSKLNKTWKKSLWSKLLELCKTRTKKSGPNMLKFYVILARHEMITDAGRATTCRRKFKAPWLQTKSTKNEGPSENMSFNGETVWKFQTKKNQKL